MLTLFYLTVISAYALICQAQTTVQRVQACLGTMRSLYPILDTVNYPPTDQQAFTFTWTYDPASCVGIYMGAGQVNYYSKGTTTYISGFGGPYVSSPASNTPLDGSGLITFGIPQARGTISTDYSYRIGAPISYGKKSATNTYSMFFTSPYFSVSHNAQPATASYGQVRRRRAMAAGARDHSGQRFRSHCAQDSEYCSVPGRPGVRECMNTLTDIESCGGCPGTIGSTNCADIDGVDNVDCADGRCIVISCQEEYSVSTNSSSCIRT